MRDDECGIGAMARQTGLSVPTIRYYEEIGLLQPASRRAGGHRIYGGEDLRRLTFIANCRDLGFSIDRIRSLVAVTVDNRPCAEARDIAKGHLAAVNTKIAELTEIKRHLERFVRQCKAGCADRSGSDCVIVDDLSGPATRRRRRPNA